MVSDRKHSTLIKNAIIPDSKAPVDILIEDGVIADIGEFDGEGVDAEGRMVSAGFVNIHTHLDKADLLARMSREQFGKSLMEKRSLVKSFKADYSVEEIKERAESVVREFVRNGVTAIRTQVDVDRTCGLKPIEALSELKEAVDVELQLCVFPQEGVLDEKSRSLIEQALEQKADLMGGLPLVEKTQQEQIQHIDVLFELARKYDVDLDLQIDESNNPQEFLLPVLAEKTIENKWSGRVSATHCISLSAVDDKIAYETIKLMVEAKLNVIVTPSANLITQYLIPDGIHSRAANSITRVKELIEAGLNVSLGTDNIRDIFYPLGNCSILREMHVLASATRMTMMDDPERLFEISSQNGARIMNLDYGVRKGAKADLVILNGRSCREAMNSWPIIPYVFKDGRVVCESKLEVKDGR